MGRGVVLAAIGWMVWLTLDEYIVRWVGLDREGT